MATGSFDSTRRRTPWLAVTIGGISLYVALSFLYLLWGKPNADEGWYLYAAKLVLHGQVPYQDFAYTQMPLLPYIYGIPQAILIPSLYLGRATSIFFSVLSLIICIWIARMYAGEMAGGIVSMLFAAFVYGIYYSSIVKTYALVSFFFTLTFLTLSSRVNGNAKYPLAVAFAICAAMVRLSALIFALTIIVYGLAQPQKTVRLVVCLLCLAAIVGLLFFFLPNPQAAKWNLLGYHLSQWGDLSVELKIKYILFLRLPDIVRFFGPYLLLLFAVMYLTCRRVAAVAFLQRNLPILAVAIGLVLFAGSHLVSGGWEAEYLVPAVSCSLPIIAILFCKIYDYQKANHKSNLLLWGVLVIALLLFPFSHGAEYIDASSGKLPLEEIKQVAEFVSQHSAPSDRILVLEALWVAIDSDRSVLPGMTMAQFSYQEVDRAVANNLRVVNDDILLEYINHRAAAVIVLTDVDWHVLARSGQAELIRQALDEQYELALTVQHFGQMAEGVYVYLPRVGA